MHQLYYSPGSASLCVHQALIEIGAPFRLIPVDLAAGEQREPWFLQLNPGGTVPTLLIDGKPFAETAALLMTLATRHPHAGLAPEEASAARADWHQWMVYLANTLHPAFRLWFYPQDISDDPAVQALVKDAARRKIEAVWSRIDTHLAHGGPCLLGSQFSCADLMLIMLMRWSRGMPKPAASWPALHPYALRMGARESWQRACSDEAISAWP